MSLTDHVQAELALIPEDIATPRMKAAIAELAAATVDHYDSGGSAPYGAAIVADLFKRSFMWEPLTPVEDNPADWIEVAEQNGLPMFQHRRYSGLFKDGANGRPYAIDRVVWTEHGGGGFTGWDSKRYVELPWTPTEPRRVWHRVRWVERTWARLTGRLVTA